MTLEQRVDRLERSCRRWRVGCLGAVVGGMVIAAAPSPPPSASVQFTNITASHLTIRDPAGGAALELKADTTQASLQVSSPAVGMSAILVAGKDGANLFMNHIGAKGVSNASVGVDEVSASIALKNADGKTKDVEP